jgi:hypothetical protein
MQWGSLTGLTFLGASKGVSGGAVFALGLINFLIVYVICECCWEVPRSCFPSWRPARLLCPMAVAPLPLAPSPCLWAAHLPTIACLPACLQ